MFGRPPTTEALKLQEAKLKLLDQLLDDDPDNEDYARRLEFVKEIDALQHPKGLRRFDSNTMLTAGAHLLGIFIIVAYEQKHAMTSKATGFIQKLTT